MLRHSSNQGRLLLGGQVTRIIGEILGKMISLAVPLLTGSVGGLGIGGLGIGGLGIGGLGLGGLGGGLGVGGVRGGLGVGGVRGGLGRGGSLIGGKCILCHVKKEINQVGCDCRSHQRSKKS